MTAESPESARHLWGAWCQAVEASADELLLLVDGYSEALPSDLPNPPAQEVPREHAAEVTAALARLQHAMDAASAKVASLRVHNEFSEAFGSAAPQRSVPL